MAESRKPTTARPTAERAIDEARRIFLRKMESQSSYDAPAVSTISLAQDEPPAVKAGRVRRG